MAALSRQPDNAEITQAARTLARLEPGFLPFEIFLQVARLTTLSIVELVPLRFHEGAVEVLLLPRPADDPFWPGMVHNPGTIVRPTDQEDTYASAFARIFADELPGLLPIGEPTEFESYLRQSKRGMENTRVFWVEVTGTSDSGTFYNISSLPSDLIAGQRSYILRAAQRFSATRQMIQK